MKKKSYITVTDQFAGCGGSSSGAAQAGCEIVMAINHWERAVETHNTNFPNTAHDCLDISACDPCRYPSTDILLSSPECTNHTIAKGKRRKNLGQMDLFNPQTIDPADERSRAILWDVVRFSEAHRYNFIIVENVVEVRHWILFDSWLNAMHTLGYDHKAVFFNSMFAEAPQSRDRVYIVFWRKNNPKPNLSFTPLAHCSECGEVEAIQSWKNPFKKWGRYGKRNQYVYRCPSCAQIVEPYYTPAYTAIDWSYPSIKVGERKRPLRPATLDRIRKGLEKFNNPVLVETAYGKDTSNRVRSVEGILPTQTARQTMALAMPFIVRNYTGAQAASISEPLPTVTTVDHNSLVQPFMVTLRNHNQAHSLEEPLGTVTAGGGHHGLVQPFLASYYSGSDQVCGVDKAIPTITAGDRHALVQPDRSISVEDCYFRMLQPHEIQAAMAFSQDYVVIGNKREKVKQLGNAVTPPVMQMIVQRCLDSLSSSNF
ncbi:DNA cytosine methyltransferase (plasmid) [Acaryochloris sp. 'Moss Beach']|uniref:DNA cytosine methyltransferase n=1 Tax=Acaryochloris TaxID=155977 RepID=UPI001BAF8953|nr:MULTISPECIES: DNA cytosine methyltransferase [Acaryochloris]QUY45790.1 DNA cytosine methyltransferase [Acaryochloris marina S15]UJB72883.1 DNA cytosine methyltransferase [Acaryochloris sp. 'Moss Beach']